MPQQLFTQSGVFIAQSTSATIECWGNGGGGGGGNHLVAGGGGGGGGGYSRDVVTLTVGKSYTITIPAAASGGTGAGPTNGQTGTAVAFTGEDKSVSAAGGVGGTGGGSGGAGGAAASGIGTTKFSGGNGGADGGASNGGGGGSSAGTASNGNNAPNTGPGGANPGGGGAGGAGSQSGGGVGSPGVQPGGGGGGGTLTSDRNGGPGAPGQILITWGNNQDQSAWTNTNVGPPIKGSPWFHIWPDHDGYYRGPVPTTGTPKTFYFLSDKAALSNHGAMREGPQIPAQAQFAAWASRNPSVFYWKMKFGKVAQPNDGTQTPMPDGSLDNSSGDCLRTQNTYSGSFRDDVWTVNVLIQSSRAFLYIPNPVQGVSIPAASVIVRMRLFRSSDPTGLNPVEIATNYNEVETPGTPTPLQLLKDFTGALSDAVPYILTAHFKPGHFSLSSEYLFLETAIIQQVSGGNIAGAFGFQWNAFTGANSGVTTPAFTDGLVGTPGSSAPTMPDFTIGPDIRSPYFKSSPFQTDIQSIRPTDFSKPNVIQAFTPPFTTGPMPGPWGGPFAPGDTGIPVSRVAGPPGTRTFAPPFIAGPDPRTPWFSPHFVGRDDPVVRPIGITPTPPVSFLHLISRDPIDDPRLRRFVDQVTNILNSLIMQGVLSRKDLFNWQLNLKPPTTSGVGPPSGLFDFSQGYNPGMVYVDMQAQTAWVNLANTPQGHALWQNVKNGTIVGG